jgi:hypothetical protein
MPRHKRLSPQDKLVQEKVKAERLKRQKIEASLPPPEETQYSRIEDLPPLHPDDEAVLKKEFYEFADRVQNRNIYSAIYEYKTVLRRIVREWNAMNRAINNRPREEADMDIFWEAVDDIYQNTNVWGGITHNGDHPWDTGRFLDTPSAQKWAETYENELAQEALHEAGESNQMVSFTI